MSLKPKDPLLSAGRIIILIAQGFLGLGAIVLWSLLAPIGALMFAGTTRAVPWFLAYAVLIMLSTMVGAKTMSQPTLPRAAIIISFLMNIAGVSAIVFSPSHFFQARL